MALRTFTINEYGKNDATTNMNETLEGLILHAFTA